MLVLIKISCWDGVLILRINNAKFGRRLKDRRLLLSRKENKYSIAVLAVSDKSQDKFLVPVR